ncbi:hypothetical protein MKX03_020665, partial [Papaver bracteatum]
ATVRTFGSYVCNLYTRWGDLDISIQKQGSLLHNNHNNITCDISINNWAGVMKSHLLHFEWAKSEDINNARDGTLNSYALCLLVIFHFQTCKPPILPPLKELHTGEIGAGSLINFFYRDDLINQMKANIEKFKRERLINASSLSELFVSFFQKFSAVEIANDNYFCTYTGTWEQRTFTEKWEEISDSYLPFFDVPPLHIRDPFARTENVARSVDDTTKIFKAFRKTYAMLLSASGRDRFSLISNLVKPEIGAQIIFPTLQEINY